MTQAKKGGGAINAKPRRSPGRQELPGWTHGLRRLYDEVVDEDLPDSFRDLLARLDKAD